MAVVVGARAGGLAGGELDEELLPDQVHRGRGHDEHEHAAEVVEAEAAEELRRDGDALAVGDGDGVPGALTAPVTGENAVEPDPSSHPQLEEVTDEGREEATPRVTPEVRARSERLPAVVVDVPLAREIQERLNLSDEKHLREQYMRPALRS